MLKTEGIKSARAEQRTLGEINQSAEVIRLSFEARSAVKAIPYPDAFPRMAQPQK